MIYTVTLNPSIDYVVHLPEWRHGEVNRSKEEQFYPGGKGLNVSMVLKELGRESVAMGFIAGFTGKKIAECMEEMGIQTDFIQIEHGFSRINVKVEAEVESEINGTGPVIENHHIQSLFASFGQIQPGDMVVLAGSVPKGVSSDIYGKITRFAKEQGAKVIVDASGDVLRHALLEGPFLVKPNLQELEEFTESKITTQEELISAGKKLLGMGAEHVIISCGKNGAVYIDCERIIRQKTIDGTVVNSVGSGDSLVAGFLDEWLRTGNWENALKEGVAAGTASAFCDGLADYEQIRKVLDRLE